MKITDIDFYRCPISLTKLELRDSHSADDQIITGSLVSETGNFFPIENGIPDFTWPKELREVDLKTRELYDNLARDYDKFADIPFKTYYQNEIDIRESITDRLRINENSRILEVGGGDGRGAYHILKRLGKDGRLFFQELSSSFLRSATNRLKGYEDKIEFSLANASYLSFPDNSFDAAHHFGGINTFSEIKRCLSEMARVVKPGGKVVVGDEGIGPWLRDSEFGKIMINSNPLVGCDVPINLLPEEARDVKVEWIMMGAFFLIEFTVGDGSPVGNYHIPIPSERGGTHWTRYYGKLEGITDSSKKLAYEAQQKSGKSMSDWLDDIVKAAAHQQLKIK